MYDNGGNIQNRFEYAYTLDELELDMGIVPMVTPLDTVYYGYMEGTDVLIRYDGKRIESSLTGIYNYDGWTYMTDHGTRLMAMWNDETGEERYFTYNADGMRTKRTEPNGTTYHYVYNGGSLSQMTVGGNSLYFTYDANGTPLTVTYNGTTYYYATNLQGDITAILNSAGTAVVSYTYDAWGNILDTAGTMKDTLGLHNPLRYRGYVYDEETGLYYLQSRYYNPEWGRFISADGQLSGVGGELLGNNMFAYCFNNPVNLSDPSGNWPALLRYWAREKLIKGISAGISALSQYIKNNVVKYNVPLYDQGKEPLCWAYCQVMIEDYKNGITRTQQEAKQRAIEIAIDLLGKENINKGGKPKNRKMVTFNSIAEMHSVLTTHGPLYASYGLYENGERIEGHAVVVTGVNLFTGRVYTNNPWGTKGHQRYNEFLQVFVGESRNGWRLDNCYYLY